MYLDHDTQSEARGVTSLILVDDHPYILHAVQALLQDTGYTIVESVMNGQVVLNRIAEVRPDILVLDVHMPGVSGLEILRELRARNDPLPVILLTAGLGDQAVAEAVRLGVDGVVMKGSDPGLLLTCLDAVRDGKRWIDRELLQRAFDFAVTGSSPTSDPLQRLTPRERSIVDLVSGGLRNREIGAELGLSEGTVKVYLHNIYEKLGIGNRTELAVLARSLQLNQR